MLRVTGPKLLGEWAPKWLKPAQSGSSLITSQRTYFLGDKNGPGQRKIRPVRPVNPTKQHRLQAPAAWKPVPPVPTSPLGQSLKPADPFLEHEAKIEAQVQRASIKDGPSWTLQEQDPYVEEPARCILCPKRYSQDIYPSYKNPKLLAQFVSPHSGRTYEAHITGLCAHMQNVVEREVKKAQKLSKSN